MLPASVKSKLRCGRSAAAGAADGGRLQPRPHGSGVGSPADLAAPLLALLATAAARSGATPQPRHRSLRTAAAVNDLLQAPLQLEKQLQPPERGTDASASPSSSSSSLATEALRPRRFSAPVIARLLRSTTSLQALADVVQQQSPYMDIPLVTVALLHMALLSARQQRQPPTATAVPPHAAATAAGGSSSSSGSSNGNGNGVAGPPDGTASGSPAAVQARPTSGAWQQQQQQGLFEDDGLPLQMSPLLDGDEDDEARQDDDDEDDEGGQASALLEEAAAATSPLEPPSEREEEGEGKGEEVALSEAGARPRVASTDHSSEGSASGTSSSSMTGGPVGAALAVSAAPAPATSGPPAAAAAAASDAGTSGAVAPTSAPAPTPAPASPVSSALRVLVPLVLSDLDGVGGSDLSKVLSALAVLRYDNKVVLEQLLQVLSIKLGECSPQELSNVLVCLAMLGLPPDPLVRSNIYSAVKYQSRRFGPRDLALTIWAYGAMGTDVQEDAVLVLLEASKPKLPYFSPLHLAKAAQGLAALRYKPPPEWVAAYCEALRPALRRTVSRELCAVLLALVDLQVSLDDTTRATLLVHTLTSLPSLETPELSRAIWALGRLTSAGLSVPALIDLDTSGRVLDVTLARLRSGAFSGGELAQLLEGITRLSLQPPLEWMQAYVAVLQPQLGALEPRQLAGVLGSLATQQYRPEPEMQRVVLGITQANMRQLLSDTTSTASLITALRRLNIEPPPSWTSALLEASRSALKNRCTDLHLANMAGALAAWGVKPDWRWTARLIWRSQVLMQQGRMSPRALVALLQSMSALGVQPNPVSLYLHTAASASSKPEFEPQHFSTLLPALHALGIQPPQSWLSQLMLSMYRCWERFNVTHWSSMLPALVLLKAEPPREWLQRLEEVLAPRLSDCSALQLLTLLVAISQLKQLGAQAAEAAEAAEAAAATTATTRSAAPIGAPAGATAHPNSPPSATTSTATASAITSRNGDSSSSGSDSSASGSGSEPFLSPNRLRTLHTVPRGRQRRPAAGGGGADADALLPSGSWLAAWWAASGSLLGRVRYAPSELLLTASWLVSLGMRPPSEWLEACVDVSQRYAKVMSLAEQMQLAAAVLPLAGRRAALVATKHSRRNHHHQQQQQPLAPSSSSAATVAAADAAAAAAGASGEVGAEAVVAPPAGKRSGPKGRPGKGRGKGRGAPAAGGQ
ncbi:hypothetical protein PLESTF_001519600 [Pleodorina starrii]|nr:hypothetical protein PLESTF_001519600 [Pleodorina starrii]